MITYLVNGYRIVLEEYRKIENCRRRCGEKIGDIDGEKMCTEIVHFAGITENGDGRSEASH